MGISNSKCYIWICVGFNHQVTRSCGQKLMGSQVLVGPCVLGSTYKYPVNFSLLSDFFLLYFFQHLFGKFMV